jgi:cyclic lactone autoinducer peptide
MHKKFFPLLMSGMAAFLTFFANSGISVNSWTAFYEPDIPECLKK